MTASPALPPHRTRAPLTDGRRGLLEHVLVVTFMVVPLLTLAATGPLVWGWGLGPVDVILTIAFYLLTGLGVTIGYHRLFTHRAFTAVRPLRITLALAGGMAFQGGVVTWAADHRRHHAFADAEGDPHSPWAYGSGPAALVRGFWHAHMGWLLDRDLTNAGRFAPDLLGDRDLRRIDAAALWLCVASLALPALLGGVLTGSGAGALSALFWAGLVRIALLHHVTWSINSICHLWGERRFRARGQAADVWWLALVSFGESWHNLHHADPSCARHGVGRGRIDVAARLIRAMEALGWVRDVRWPTPSRLQRLQRVEQ